MSSHKQTWIKHLLSEKQMSEAFVNSVFLALSGGFQDAYTYNTRDEVFSNAQTGNVVLMSQHFMNREWQIGLRYLFPLLAFVFGVFVAENVQNRFKYAKKMHWRQGILLAEMVSFACAMQVQTFRKVGGYSYASTMCIGNLRSGTAALSLYLRDKKAEHLRQTFYYFGIIFFFAIGAGIGGILSVCYGIHVIWISCILLFISFLLMFLEKLR